MHCKSLHSRNQLEAAMNPRNDGAKIVGLGAVCAACCPLLDVLAPCFGVTVNITGVSVITGIVALAAAAVTLYVWRRPPKLPQWRVRNDDCQTTRVANGEEETLRCDSDAHRALNDNWRAGVA